MNRHTAFKILVNALFLKLMALPLAVMILPEVFVLYTKTIVFDYLVTIYGILYAKGNIKQFVKWWKNELIKARVRKHEREEFIKHYRSNRGYEI